MNSPLLLGQRLWHETRIALFQHSVDERSAAHMVRGAPARVSFGECWLENSVIEIFREEIARFRVIMTDEVAEDAWAGADAGRHPEPGSPPTAQWHGMALEPALLRNHGRAAASAHRTASTAGRSQRAG